MIAPEYVEAKPDRLETLWLLGLPKLMPRNGRLKIWWLEVFSKSWVPMVTFLSKVTPPLQTVSVTVLLILYQLLAPMSATLFNGFPFAAVM